MKAPPKYQYDPSAALAATYAGLFALSAVLHTVQLLRNKTWYFVAFYIGILFEVVGYDARAVSAHETPNWADIPFIIQTLLPLLAPPLFAASIYMMLGRIIRLLSAEHLSIIPTRWLTKIFVLGDVLSFLVQCLGGGILAGAKTKNTFHTGENIILVGLAIQIIFFGCFVAAISIFHYRVVRQPTSISLHAKLPWKQYLFILYLASFLILVRSIFRIAEFAAGQGSTLQTTEVFLYVFDATLMLLCCVSLNVRHPSRVVSRNGQLICPNVELDDNSLREARTEEPSATPLA